MNNRRDDENRIRRGRPHQLRMVIPELIARWEPLLDVAVPRWSIRRMKTKWDSCNRETGHIWLNVELAKKHNDAPLADEWQTSAS